ncbi:AEC family transporter [Chthonobacter albigriseus]|uniref:AEC family transporter n=1 Tax=Chthonobacter albigriseus TaxID=1683161 RepID=UPI0015EFD2A5|nr:AEC family transporter [Chthonobacter albigriseus]
MSQIVDNVIPIFALIAIGWAAVALRLLKAEVGDALGDFVFKLAVPVLLFRTIAEADLDGSSPWTLWAAYFSGVAVTWTVGHLLATRVFKRDARLGVVAGVSSAFANNVFIGLPLVGRMLSDQGVAALSILLSVHLPVMMIAGTLMMERAERAVEGKAGQGIGAILRQVARNLVRNPLVIGLVAGSLFRLTGLPIGGIPEVVMDQIAGLAGPAALLSMGMAVRKYGVRGHLGPAVTMSALKLFLLPASVYVAAHLLELSPVWTAAMVLTSSVPTGVNAYLIANHFGVGHGLASSTITLTTALGVFTVSIWAVILGV